MSRSKNMSNRSERSTEKKLWKHSFFYYIAIPVGIVLAGVLAFGGYIYWFYNIRRLPPPPELSPIRSQVQNGDIILRSGVGFWSKFFRERNETDQRFSHVGVVLIDNNGNCVVMHAEADDMTGDGTVHIISLEKFVHESDAIGISRLHTLDPEKFAAAVSKYAGRPFDWKFNSIDHSAIYCTELVELAMKDVDPGVFLKRDSDDVILPEACLDKRYFREIDVSQ